MEDKVVALSTGTYDELVWIRGELWGACAAETHITYTGEVTLDPRGDSPALVAARHTKNVSLSGSREVTGISVGLSGSVSGVLLEGFDRGIRGHSGTITVSDTIIRGAQYGMQSGAVFDRDNEFSFEGVIFEDTFVSINVNSFESRTNLLQVRDSAFVGGLAMWLVTTDIDVQRTVFTGGTGSAIVARGGNAVLADVVVERLMSGDGGLDGSGLAFYGGSSDDTLVEIDRVRIEDVRDFALRSGGTGLRVEGRDLLVRGVTPEDCWPDTCPDSSGGVGVVASAGAVDLERFVVQDCSLCGVMVSDEGDLDLRNGRVSGNDLGACLQVDGYDTDRVSDGVIYRDNNSNLEATSLPVPDVMGTLPL